MAPDQISALVEGKYLKIFVMGVLHIELYLEAYIALQAWVESEQVWCVYIYMNELTEPIQLEYHNEDMWKAVLKLLNEHL